MDNGLMQVKSIAEHSAVLLTCIKLLHGFKTFVLSIFEWRLKTGPGNMHTLVSVFGAVFASKGYTFKNIFTVKHYNPSPWADFIILEY